MTTPTSPSSSYTSSTTASRQAESSGSSYSPGSTYSPPKARLTRKRAAEKCDVESENDGRDDQRDRLRDINRVSVEHNARLHVDSLGNGREMVCLCQPEPKIPRPRNAFILFRQYMQSQVVAQNPGLSNPEISKIIGTRWKDLEADTKEHWKDLAEEEKRRHQRQYPGYRYQPKRGGKTNGGAVATTPTDAAQTRCPKCQGRYISTPNTPITPFFSPLSVTHDRGNPGFPFSLDFPKSHSHGPDQNGIHSPAWRPLIHTLLAHRTPPDAYRRPSLPPLHTHYEQQDESLGTAIKRRRLEADEIFSAPPEYHQPLPLLSRGSSHDTVSTPISMSNESYPFVHSSVHSDTSRRESIVEVPQSSTLLHPPPHQHYPTRPSMLSTTFHPINESLRLPPLQTQLPFHARNGRSSLVSCVQAPFDSQFVELRPQDEVHENGKESIEMMLSNMSAMHKVSILSQISPPHKVSSLDGSLTKTRGCIIAVDGIDRTLSCAIGAFIQDVLEADSGCVLRTWRTLPREVNDPRSALTTINPSSYPTSLPLDDAELAIVLMDAYKDIVNHMRHASIQIQQFITTALEGPHTPRRHHSIQSARQPLQVALLPNNYSLTFSDLFASMTPITDAYAPVDHWQWMATHWRYTIGPDLIIHCSAVSTQEYDKYGAIDVREGDEKAPVVVLVRVPQSVVQGLKEKGRKVESVEDVLDEKIRRRLAFEVAKFVKCWDGGMEK